MRTGVGFDEVVSAPLDSFHGVAELPVRGQLLPILQYAPRHHGHRERHWQPELHVVPCIVVPSDQIHLLARNSNLFSVSEMGFREQFGLSNYSKNGKKKFPVLLM